jgi:hypothetical protein
VSFVNIGAGNGHAFHVGVIEVAVTARAVEPCDILKVKNAYVLRHGMHHFLSFSPNVLSFDTM